MSITYRQRLQHHQFSRAQRLLECLRSRVKLFVNRDDVFLKFTVSVEQNLASSFLLEYRGIWRLVAGGTAPQNSSVLWGEKYCKSLEHGSRRN